jgi:hypothetical protein
VGWTSRRAGSPNYLKSVGPHRSRLRKRRINVAAGERWSVFIDTTELWHNRELKDRFAETAKRTGAGLYACELVIEERAFQQLRGFHKKYTRIQSAKAKVERYVKVEIGEPKGDKEMLGEFRREERAALEGDGFTIIPAQGLTAAEHAALLEYRDPRLNDEKGRGVPAGLNDAVILLSSMKFAQVQSLDKCLFVSKNTGDFSDRIVEGLGGEYGQEWRFSTNLEAAIRFLSDPDSVKAATDFVRANHDRLLNVIENEKANLWADGLILGPPTLQDIEAFPIGRSADGAEVQMRFQATVMFEQRLTAEPSPLRAASILYYSTFQSSVFGESPSQVRGVEGEAAARYEKGQFVGEVRILTVRPRGLEIRIAN